MTAIENHEVVATEEEANTVRLDASRTSEIPVMIIRASKNDQGNSFQTYEIPVPVEEHVITEDKVLEFGATEEEVADIDY